MHFDNIVFSASIAAAVTKITDGPVNQPAKTLKKKKGTGEFPKFPLYFNVRKYYTKENDDVNKKVFQPFSFASTIIGLDNPGNPTQCRDFPSAL